MKLLLRKSTQLRLDLGGTPNPNPHHVAYRRTNRRGTVSQVRQLGFDFSRPPEPAPRQRTVSDLPLLPSTTMRNIIANGKALFDFLTKDVREMTMDEKNAILEPHREAWRQANDALIAARARARISGVTDLPDRISMYHPAVKNEHQTVAQAMANLNRRTEELGSIHERRRIAIVDHFRKNTDAAACAKRAKDIIGNCVSVEEAGKKAITEAYQVVGHAAIPTLKVVIGIAANKRASANATGWIKLSKQSCPRTIFHEMGHHLEYSHPELYSFAADFRLYKASQPGGNTTPAKLNTIAPVADDTAVTRWPCATATPTHTSGRFTRIGQPKFCLWDFSNSPTAHRSRLQRKRTRSICF